MRYFKNIGPDFKMSDGARFKHGREYAEAKIPSTNKHWFEPVEAEKTAPQPKNKAPKAVVSTDGKQKVWDVDGLPDIPPKKEDD